MKKEALEEVHAWEQQLEQRTRDYIQLLQPVLQVLGVQVQLELCRSEPASSAHYKSTLDVRFVDEAGRVLWVDSLIVCMNSARWAEEGDVIPFMQEAFREALQSWRGQMDK